MSRLPLKLLHRVLQLPAATAQASSRWVSLQQNCCVSAVQNCCFSCRHKCHGTMQPLRDGSLPGKPTVLPSCAGAYGTVYKALRDGVQVVAVKKFHHLEDPRQQRSIMKEVSILKGCR